MADTEKLGKMLDNLINNKDADAEIDFHDFAQEKMKELIHGTDDKNNNGNKEE